MSSSRPITNAVARLSPNAIITSGRPGYRYERMARRARRGRKSLWRIRACSTYTSRCRGQRLASVADAAEMPADSIGRSVAQKLSQSGMATLSAQSRTGCALLRLVAGTAAEFFRPDIRADSYLNLRGGGYGLTRDAVRAGGEDERIRCGDDRWPAPAIDLLRQDAEGTAKETAQRCCGMIDPPEWRWLRLATAVLRASAGESLPACAQSAVKPRSGAARRRRPQHEQMPVSMPVSAD